MTTTPMIDTWEKRGWFVDRTTAYRSSFKDEREVCDHLERMIEHFTQVLAGEPLLRYEREHHLHTNEWKGRSGSARVDFLIETEHHRIFIEVKNKASQRYQSWGIGQLLSYAAEADQEPDMLVFVSSEAYELLTNTIKRFKLPVEYVFIGDDVWGRWNLRIADELERRHHGETQSV